ncbi:MAG: 23S rRNA (pseudouridine(1915)-N(3))-methyltransferase RlmH [Prevotellaceae bacterium]|jgi:23S rRNA (pseudouridine1915-N3)-methyltransferase|nr:23S rRNA (pseudouridine(1915)-N(3))-methyltransferase RlmH [Prevotellaceae bacterium]
MKIALLFVGKTENGYLPAAVAMYVERLARYVSVEVKIIPEKKNTRSLSAQEQKKREGELILSAAGDGELLLLDERGKEFSSEEFSLFLSKKMQGSAKQITFVSGGAYGFSEEVYRRANEKIALSRMTFSHQMVRLFFVEQLYRAFTIMKGEPYHHK